MSSSIKDRAFVSVYNDGDISDYLYTTPAFTSGYLPLDPEDETHHHIASNVAISSKARPAATLNTENTPTRSSNKMTDAAQTQAQSALKPVMPSKTTGNVVEPRPSFSGVTTPTVHTHENAHKAPHHTHRRHSSDAHLPMSWWPEDDASAQHEWAEQDGSEEEDMIEEELWSGALYE